VVKMFFFFKRRPDLSPEEFHRYWREQHGPFFCKTAAARRFVTRYEQNHAAPEDADLGGGDFDGVSIMWFRSIEDVRAMRADPEYREVVLDGHNFIDMSATRLMFSLAEEQFDIPLEH